MLAHLVFTLLLVILSFLVHGHALTEGLFLDDHWHVSQWARQDWSWSSWADDTTIEPARFIHLWWQDKPVRFEYFRPISVAVAKGVYRIMGSDPYWLHALSLILNALNSVLVYALGFALTRRMFWPAVGGVLLILYSHNIYSVSWLAAQNIVLMTTWALLLVLQYVRWSRRTGLWATASVHPGQWAGSARAESSSDNAGAYHAIKADLPDRDRDLPQGTHGLALLRFPLLMPVGCVLLLILALLTRENAVVLPAFLIALDFAFGGMRAVRARWTFHAFCLSCVIAFLILRAQVCQSPMPDVYVRYPDGWSYLPWALAKLMHYVTSVIWLSPMTVGPTGRHHPFLDAPGDCLLMAAIIGVMGWGYWRACRQVRGFWLWPLWIVLAVLPVVPVLATPHSGYFPSVGFALAMILGPATRVTTGRSWRRYIHGSALVAGWFVIANWIYQPIYRGLWSAFRSAEKYTIDQIMMDPPDDSVEHVFFLNLPFVNIYAPIQLLERGVDRTVPHQYHVLTFAPHALAMKGDPVIRRLGERSFAVQLRSDAYFSGLLGRFLVEAMRSDGMFKAGDQCRNNEFAVEVVSVSDRGVDELRFTFNRPLQDGAYKFYLGTESCPAAILKFTGDADGNAWEGQYEIIQSSNESLDDLRQQRDRLEDNRRTTAQFIRTDLYLTGPPYPGPN